MIQDTVFTPASSASGGENASQSFEVSSSLTLVGSPGSSHSLHYGNSSSGEVSSYNTSSLVDSLGDMRAPEFLADVDLNLVRTMQSQLDAWVEASPDAERNDRTQAAIIIRESEYGTVHLRGLQITCLPDGIEFKSLRIENCPWVRSLPEALVIDQDLQIIACAHFSNLPRLELNGDLTLLGLPILHDWLRSANVGGHLLVQDCPALVTLPYILNVKGDATFAHCSVLRGVSERLRIGGDLRLQDCAELTNLPFAPIELGGHLILEDLPFLRELPHWLDRLNQGEAGRQCVFHNIAIPAIEQRFVQERLVNVDVQLDDFVVAAVFAPDFTTQIQGWLDVSEAGYAGEAQQLVQALPQSMDLMAFLQRLSQTREYELQPVGLGQRVSLMLHQMADNVIPQEQAMELIHNTLSSCNDGLMMCLRDLEMLALIEQALKCPMPAIMLRGLGEDLVKIEAIHAYAFEIAQQQKARNENPDEVEIVLYLETALAGRLALPLQNRHMLFEARSGIGALHVNEAERRALTAAANTTTVNDFLEQWRPWQVFKRKEAIASFSKTGQSLRLMSETEQEMICPITREAGRSLKEPVCVKNQVGIFELKDLLIWWEANGCHPITRGKMSLESLQLLRKRTNF